MKEKGMVENFQERQTLGVRRHGMRTTVMNKTQGIMNTTSSGWKGKREGDSSEDVEGSN